jgi:hypothetical protein
MLFPILAAAPAPSFFFDVVSGKGLLVSSKGVPLINGSGIQFYKPGWSKGYYSSTQNSQQIQKVDASTVNASFVSDDGLSQGTVTYHVNQDHLEVHYDLVWNGDEPANAEVTAGLLWTPPFERGQLSADGKPARALDQADYKSSDIEVRRFSPDATSYSFATPAGAVTEKSSLPLTLFDGRGSTQDWAANHEYYWLGALALPLQKGKHTTFDVDYEFDLRFEDRADSKKLTLIPQPTTTALLPDTAHPPLIPKPQTAQLDWNHPLAYGGGLTFPAGVFDHLDLFKAALARRFDLSQASALGKIAFDAGISKLGLVPGGYKITIDAHSISVLGEEDEGLRNGLQRLASLAFVSNGKLCFPTGFLRDQPHTTFRGVHLFVGNRSLPFHQKLWTRVLSPLGMNKVVLQCERTHWDSQPDIDTKETMPKEELVRLFQMYRSIGVDPIPLIESVGHMQWFFANGKNRDLALDPEHPYAIDPSNPKSLAAITKLWDEAIEALNPDIVHFGLDEVDLVGRKLGPKEKTEMWSTLMGALEKLSRAQKVQMMLWGDEALAPGEAPDATFAESAKDAADRRSAIPQGSLIGDWHYAANSDPSVFLKNLQIWKDTRLQPIASTWYRPSNIAGFDVEAGRLGCGTLQTTWCGYESSEASLTKAFEQFSAMVLAADYAWSARTDLPSKLDYDPAEVFRKMYFGAPSPLAPVPGTDLGFSASGAPPLEIGSIRYGSPGALTIPGALSGLSGGGAILSTNVKAKTLAFAVNTFVRPPEDGVPVADIVVNFEDGKHVETVLVYGTGVRTTSDLRPTLLADRNADGVCSFKLDLGGEKSPIRVIGIKPMNRITGLQVRGIEAIH